MVYLVIGGIGVVIYLTIGLFCWWCLYRDTSPINSAQENRHGPA